MMLRELSEVPGAKGRNFVAIIEQQPHRSAAAALDFHNAPHAAPALFIAAKKEKGESKKKVSKNSACRFRANKPLRGSV